MSLLSLLRLIPGASVRAGQDRYRVIDLVSAGEVLVESPNGTRRSIKAVDLSPDFSVPVQSQADVLSIPPKAWERALETYEGIRPLIEMAPGSRNRKDVEAVAKKLDKSVATVYRWLNQYEETGLVSSLVRVERKDKGTSKLDEQVEAVVKETIESFYLTAQRRSVTKTSFEIRKKCKEKGLSPPAERTVTNRIFNIGGEYKLRKRRGSKAADEKYLPLRGSFPNANYPLAVVQIDHTPMDVILVDDVHRKPIGRPFLTVAFDVCTKMAAGFYISLDPPGALATGLCLSQAILGKEAYLIKLGVEHLPWPLYGLMRTIHTDNAREFRGTMLGKAAKNFGIICERRPKGQPRYGGHVERMFRTYMTEVHNEIPGTTFSNVQQKLEYDSEGRAIMTLDALNKWFTIFILGVYHQQPHAGNDGLPPLAKWNEGIFGADGRPGTGMPMRVEDEEKLRLDFLPYILRTVQEYGIRIEGIDYWTDAIRRFVHALDPNSITKKRQFICRYDPRDLSKIWLFDPDSKKYVEIPYRDLSRAAISKWELRGAKVFLRNKSISATNETLIFKSVDEMRAVVESEAEKTKSARRMHQRQKQWKKAPPSKPAAKNALAPAIPVSTADDEYENDILPFASIRES